MRLSFWIVVLALLAGSGSASRALVFAGAENEPKEAVPPDFPYWEHVTQRRYQGPTVIYLGGGWALTAKHVGQGEISVQGEIFAPEARSRHTLLNIDGSLADGLLFELDRKAKLPDLPLLPIAKQPPQPGEEVLLIGFGRGGGRVVQWPEAPPGTIGFEWTQEGRKRWGTNRVFLTNEWLAQSRWLTHSLVLRFDDPLAPESTPFEAQAATGDSGGAVFVKHEGGWALAGLMTSVTSSIITPPKTSAIGDMTYAADLSSYRSEILRWARPACANEEDDDGDGLVDFPADPDCKSEADRDERRLGLPWHTPIWAGALGAGVLGLLIGALAWMRNQRGRSTPSSTRPSSAA